MSVFISTTSCWLYKLGMSPRCVFPTLAKDPNRDLRAMTSCGFIPTTPLCRTLLSPIYEAKCQLCATKRKSENKQTCLVTRKWRTAQVSPLVNFRSRPLQPCRSCYRVFPLAALQYPSSSNENTSGTYFKFLILSLNLFRRPWRHE